MNSYSERQYVSDRSSIETLSSANAAGRIQRAHVQEELSPQEEVDDTKALQSGQTLCNSLQKHPRIRTQPVYKLAL